MVPAAPAVFSTTTGCPKVGRMPCAMIRPSVSVEPPGASGTTMGMGRDGYSSAQATGIASAAAKQTAAAAVEACISLIGVSPCAACPVDHAIAGQPKCKSVDCGATTLPRLVLQRFVNRGSVVVSFLGSH